MDPDPYPYHGYIKKQKKCAEVFLPGLYEFHKEVSNYINALLNTLGGIIKVGIGEDGYVKGVACPRNVEDNIKLTVDNTVKYYQPKISPSCYRLDFVPCEVTDHINCGYSYPIPDIKVIEIHVSAGPEILYMDKNNQKSMVLHDNKPLILNPQEIRRLAIAKYKQEVLTADTLWDVITPACFKKNESKLKKPSSSAVICTQTTPGLAPVATPKPHASSSASVRLDSSNTPCPTPVAELFASTDSAENTPNTVVKVSSKRSLSPDNSGTAVKRMPPRSCKAASRYVTIEDSPEVVCIGSFNNNPGIPGIDVPILVNDSPLSTPFARESNGDTVVRRVLRSSSKINDNVEPSLVKNPSDLFSDEPEERGRSRKRHKAGDSSRHRSKERTPPQNSNSRGRHRSSPSRHRSSPSRHRSSPSRHRSRKRSDSKSPETSHQRRGERPRRVESKTRKESGRC
ncbi:uncharacterized protein [Amphiura filiformis]|uniref:uncharacterized protein isoform X2 n=1 Tax=Amphiura filiformis TaxID=82378 RepID=UPI003B228F26